MAERRTHQRDSRGPRLQTGIPSDKDARIPIGRRRETRDGPQSAPRPSSAIPQKRLSPPRYSAQTGHPPPVARRVSHRTNTRCHARHSSRYSSPYRESGSIRRSRKCAPAERPGSVPTRRIAQRPACSAQPRPRDRFGTARAYGIRECTKEGRQKSRPSPTSEANAVGARTKKPGRSKHDLPGLSNEPN